MAPTLLVTTALQRIPRADANQAWFMLTLTTSARVAADAKDPAVRALLRSWHWNEVSNVRVGYLKGGAFTDLGLRPVVSPTVDVTPIVTKLDGVFDALPATAFALDPREQSELPDENAQDGGTSKPHVSQRLWIEVQGAAIRLPAPIGHGLKQVVVFWLPTADLAGADSVLAVPVISATETWKPAPTPVAPPAEHAFYTYTYVPTPANPAVDIVGLVVPAANAEPKGGLWIDPPAVAPWGGRDWLARLPYDVATVLDVPGLLAGAAREVLDGRRKPAAKPEDASLTSDEASWLRRAVLVALRWQAHAGLAPSQAATDPPLRGALSRTARALSDELLAQVPPDQLDTFLRQLTSKEQSTDLTSIPDAADLRLKAWMARLSALSAELPGWLSLAKVTPEETLVGFAGELDGLERLADAVRAEETLAALLASEWRQVQLDGKFTFDLSALETTATKLALAQRLIVDRLDEVWAAIIDTKSAATIVEIRDRLVKWGQALVDALFATAGTPPTAGTLGATIIEGIRTAMKKAADAIGPEDGDAADQRTETAHPLVFTLGDLVDAETVTKHGDPAGNHAMSAGMCVLMRRKAVGPATWYPLNIASVFVDGKLVAGLKTVLAPRPVATLNGVEAVSVAYDEHPLTARSLFGALTDDFELSSDTPIENALDVDLYQPDFDGTTLTQLPGLYFGETYEAAGFRVLLGGALPTQVSDASNPLSFVAPDALTGINILGVPYLRRGAVGAPRLIARPRKGDPRATPGAFKTPEIRRDLGVFPLADEIEPATASNIPGEVTPIRKAVPLMLLGPPETAPDRELFSDDVDPEFVFGVLPPSADVRVWRRWVGWEKDPNHVPKDEQARVLGHFHEHAPRTGTEARPDLAIDDPVIAPSPENPADESGRCGFRLQRHGFSATGVSEWTTVGPVMSARFEAAQPQGFERFQCPPLTVKVVSHVDEGVAIANPEVTVRVQAGGLYRLEIASLVRPDLMYGSASPRFRFTKHKFDAAWKTQEAKEWIPVAKETVLIEVATVRLPEREAVWNALTVVGSSASELIVGLDPAASGAKPGTFDYVKQVSVDLQEWRWSGRKLVPLPVPTFSDPSSFYGVEARTDAPPAQVASWADLIAWDGAGFADRLDSDALVHAGLFPRARRAAQVCRIDVAHDRRAMYYRFRATVRSRYLGLLRPDKRAASGQLAVGWRRLVIKNAVKLPKLPRPKLRFLLPLTQQLESGGKDQRRTAPILAMLEESWGSVAGFAESLLVELVDAEVFVPGFEPKRLPERGHDPRQDGAELASGAAPFELKFTLDPAPFGLTFDVGLPVQWPASTCFVLRGEGEAIQPGDMAKVRFRRIVRRDSSVADATGLEPVQGSPPAAPDEWTDAHWVQLLPDFTLWDADQPKVVDVATLSLARNGDSLSLRSDASRVKLRPRATHPDGFVTRKLFFVVTRLVTEVFGNRVSESPVALADYPTEAAGDTDLRLSAAKLPDGRLRLRILEVEMRKGAAMEVEPAKSVGEQGLWQWLFDSEMPDPEHEGQTVTLPDRLRAVIVRVSPPIDEASAADAPR